MTKTKTLTLIEDQAKLKDAITSHGKKRGAIDQETHMLAVSAAAVFEKHGNVFYINHLYANMGKGARHVALTAWLLEFAGVMANDGENKDTTPFIKDANKKVDLVGGTATPWYDLKASPKPDEVIDILALTLKVIAKASKPKAGQQVAHAAMLTELQALAEKFTDAEDVALASEGPEAPM